MRLPRIALLAALLSLSGWVHAGPIGKTLGKYASAGAGIGALVGCAAATVPYLQSKQPYDFYTGAGAGLLAGASLGFLLGIVDVSTRDWDEAPAEAGRPVFFAWAGPQGAALACRIQF
jgi:hypothetical protein